jgi:hypothetical protein
MHVYIALGAYIKHNKNNVKSNSNREAPSRGRRVQPTNTDQQPSYQPLAKANFDAMEQFFANNPESAPSLENYAQLPPAICRRSKQGHQDAARYQLCERRPRVVGARKTNKESAIWLAIAVLSAKGHTLEDSQTTL